MALVSHLDHLLDMADLNFTFDNGGKARILSKYISTVPHQLGIFSGIFMTVIGIVSIALNLIVLLVQRRRPFALRVQAIELYKTNLTLIDLLVPVLNYALPVYSGFVGHWAFGHIGCVWYAFNGFLTGTLKIHLLASLTIVWYIQHGNTGIGGERLKRIAIINILGIYVYSLLWACTPLFGWGEYDVESFGTACSLNWHYDSQRYFITIYAVIVLFPLTFTALCLCSICSHAQVEDEEWDQLKIMIANFVTFLVTWGPYGTIGFLSSFRVTDSINPLIVMLAFLWLKLMVLFDPLSHLVLERMFKNEAIDFIREVFGMERINSTAPEVITAEADLVRPSEERELCPSDSDNNCNTQCPPNIRKVSCDKRKKKTSKQRQEVFCGLGMNTDSAARARMPSVTMTREGKFTSDGSRSLLSQKRESGHSSGNDENTLPETSAVKIRRGGVIEYHCEAYPKQPARRHLSAISSVSSYTENIKGSSKQIQVEPQE